MTKIQSQSTSNPTSIAQYGALRGAHRLHGFRAGDACRVRPQQTSAHSRGAQLDSRRHLRPAFRRVLRVPRCLRALRQAERKIPPRWRSNCSNASTLPWFRATLSRRARVSTVLLRHLDRPHRRGTAASGELLYGSRSRHVKLAPSRISPILVPRIWGARTLAPLFEAPAESEPIGEVWLTGESCAFASGPLAGRTHGEAWPTLPGGVVSTEVEKISANSAAGQIPSFPTTNSRYKFIRMTRMPAITKRHRAESARPRCGTPSPRSRALKFAWALCLELRENLSGVPSPTAPSKIA